ncbi:MAG: HD domain-containing protein [Patescibacteria group bacterium]
MWSKKEQQAVEFSFKAHEGQKRKGTDIAYVSHPMIVGLILAKISDDEDVIIAGILHDIIEDTKFTKADIKNKFGSKVANLVDQVSEKDRDLPYIERKDRAAAKLFTIDEEAVLVKAADVLSNITDLSTDLDKRGEESFKIFHPEKEVKIKQIERVINIIISRIGDQKITKEMQETFKEIKKYED